MEYQCTICTAFITIVRNIVPVYEIINAISVEAMCIEPSVHSFDR